MKHIIGIGWGAEQSHYTRKPFGVIEIDSTPKIKINKCNRCAVDISKGHRYCEACKKHNRRKTQRKYRYNK